METRVDMWDQNPADLHKHLLPTVEKWCLRLDTYGCKKSDGCVSDGKSARYPYNPYCDWSILESHDS